MRIATFNVRHCAGLDGKVDVERTAGVIRATGAELIALQELDRGLSRSGGVDQPAELQRLTGLNIAFHPTIQRGGGHYGIAIATADASAFSFSFEALPRVADEEPRGLLLGPWRGLTVVATHLSLQPQANLVQIRATAARAGMIGGPHVVLGDLNRSGWGVRRVSGGGLRPPWRPRRTMARRWAQRDHIAVGGGAYVVRLRSLRTDASDHWPLVADVEVT